MRSKPDRVVVSEMFHVKAWQELSRDENPEEFHMNAFYVALGPMAKICSKEVDQIY